MEGARSATGVTPSSGRQNRHLLHNILPPIALTKIKHFKVFFDIFLFILIFYDIV